MLCRTREDFALKADSSAIISKPDVQSSPDAPATSAPSLHLRNPRARPPRRVRQCAGTKTQAGGLTSTEVQIAPSSVPSFSCRTTRLVELLQQRSRERERERERNHLLPEKRNMRDAHTAEALYGTCARSASPYGQVKTMTNW